MGKRGHGEGNITHRKDGTWQGSISFFDPVKNVRKRPTVYGKTRKEVQMKLQELQAQRNAGLNIAPDKITLGEWIKRWLQDYAKANMRTGTWEGYQTNFKNHINPVLGNILLTKLTTNDLQKFYNQKLENGRKDGKGLSIRTVKLIHVVIHASLKQAHKEGMVLRNVSEFVRLPADTKKEVKPLSPEQITSFLSAIREDKLYPAFALELSTGLRRGELLGLQWKDIDMQTGKCQIRRSLVKNVSNTIDINEPKTKTSKRIVIIPENVLDILEAHRDRQEQDKIKEGYLENDWVFCTEEGKPLSPRNFTRKFDRLLEKAKMEHIPFHALRHSVATALLVNGVNLKVVSAQLGHADIRVTADTYSHVLEEVQKQTSDILGTLIPET